ncbi:hypothetical protein QVD17_15020 [Tagetes erecta]|uniref:Uncharacterized protein n=1 Tax=Tagetes erecta TaxID=13708 RepID=A0AAD8NZB5_TARER|nr:hypothetical protein QVD17_15020 [Tagetes erecta]
MSAHYWLLARCRLENCLARHSFVTRRLIHHSRSNENIEFVNRSHDRNNQSEVEIQSNLLQSYCSINMIS